jgi:hypothetical protein
MRQLQVTSHPRGLSSRQCFTLDIVEFMIDIDTDKYYLYDGKKCTAGFRQLNPNNRINTESQQNQNLYLY